jgi:hypothetical protein
MPEKIGEYISLYTILHRIMWGGGFAYCVEARASEHNTCFMHILSLAIIVRVESIILLAALLQLHHPGALANPL